MTEKLMLALELGGKGMLGIFAVLGILAICVWALGEWDKKTKQQ